ncbi:MAG: hypothetical protein WBZ20_11545, partial [Nitrososphaeraceae archaeon]
HIGVRKHMLFGRVKVPLFVPSLSPSPRSSLAKFLHFTDGENIAPVKLLLIAFRNGTLQR